MYHNIHHPSRRVEVRGVRVYIFIFTITSLYPLKLQKVNALKLTLIKTFIITCINPISAKCFVKMTNFHNVPIMDISGLLHESVKGNDGCMGAIFKCQYLSF